MQNTLMRLMNKKGLRRDPFQKLVTTAITPVDENFTDSPTSSKTNPLSTRKLKLRNKGHFDGAEPPNSKQDPFLKTLKQGTEAAEDNFEQEPPSEKQNPLLKNLRGQHAGQLQGQAVPSLRQSNLLRPLTSGNSGSVSGLEPPTRQSVNDLQSFVSYLFDLFMYFWKL